MSMYPFGDHPAIVFMRLFVFGMALLGGVLMVIATLTG